jgi:KaiC/GvpD/RAD55 family RecA-like ATPase
MISYIEYLNVPATLSLLLIGVFLVIQIVGEILEFKGQVVPEFVKVRKYFARKKQERKTVHEMSATIHEVKTLLGNVESHYSKDNIAKRDSWMRWVNDRAEVYDKSIAVLKEGLDKNNEITMSLYVESKRSSIISFASYCVCPDNPVTREQFKRVFRIYSEYEDIIRNNGLTNGEVDIAIRIIREAYENNLRNHSFVEDVRGYEHS